MAVVGIGRIDKHEDGFGAKRSLTEAVARRNVHAGAAAVVAGALRIEHMRKMLAFLMLCGMSAPAMAAEPADAVRPFYESIGLEYGDDELGRFVDPALSVLEGDRRMAEEGDLCLGFLIAIDGQDHDDGIADSLVLSQTVEGDRAEVVARFVVFGHPQQIEWQLVYQDGWKIADVGSRDNGWQLSEFTCD